MNKVTIDTNLILDDENILLKLKSKYEKIIVPLTVVKELDKLKHRPETSYSSRKAIKAVRKFMIDYPEVLEFYVNDSLMDDNDAKIIKAAELTDSTLATKDISMSILSDAKGIKTEVYDVVLNNIYKPYIYVRGEELHEHSVELNGDYFSFIQKYDNEYIDLYKYFNELLKKCGYRPNKKAWYFVFILDGGRQFVYAHNPLRNEFERIDNNHEYNEIKGSDFYLQALDHYQVCAIYALKNAPHAVITGKWGSGKSLLTTAYSMYKSVNKTFLTRPPIGINKKYDLGFMPGDTFEKMSDWLSGITSSLYFMYANTKNQNHGECTYDYVKDSIFRKKFEIIPINAIQGTSLLKNDMLLVDEIQLLDIDTMSMILSRPSKKGKLILMGDLNQTYSTIKPSESGLLKLLRILPHESVAYVELQNSYRSSILELADKLQDRTIC